jgi:hypothetical protein
MSLVRTILPYRGGRRPMAADANYGAHPKMAPHHLPAASEPVSAAAQPSQCDRAEPAERRLGRQAAGGREAIAREFVRARPHHERRRSFRPPKAKARRSNRVGCASDFNKLTSSFTSGIGSHSPNTHHLLAHCSGSSPPQQLGRGSTGRWMKVREHVRPSVC